MAIPCGMHSIAADTIRTGILAILCALLAGCAIDIGPYAQAQPVEVSVQSVLARQGYYQGPIDGRVGPSTSRAIRNYQRDHQLTSTGTINPALITSMGLAGQQTMVGAPAPAYYSGYYSPWYARPAYYAPPAVIGVGWGGGWPVAGYRNYWNRGYGGYGYRGWGGGYGYRNYGGANYCRGWR